MWSELRSVWSMYMLPDWLNIFGSFLYWVSTSSSQYSHSPDTHLLMRRIELFASCVEILAVVGWGVQWYYEYYTDLVNIPLSCVGRGFTLDDPGERERFLFHLHHFIIIFHLYAVRILFETRLFYASISLFLTYDFYLFYCFNFFLYFTLYHIHFISSDNIFFLFIDLFLPFSFSFLYFIFRFVGFSFSVDRYLLLFTI